MKLDIVLDDLSDERTELLAVVRSADLQTATPAEGWTIHDTLAHLWQTDEVALTALNDPEAFVRDVLGSAAADPTGFVDAAVFDLRGMAPDALLEQSGQVFAALLDSLAAADPHQPVVWFGPPMNPTSFATARLMEYWAHGQDIYDALGVAHPPTLRLRHICHLGFRTRQFSYVLRGLTVPDAPVGLELQLPDGSLFTALPDAPQRITGLAEEFCLVVTQRRGPEQTKLIANGGDAQEWLEIAQCFAGPPGRGRA